MAMLFMGVCFGVAGFIVPPLGEISNSVLYFCAQCFIYAGSAMGIAVYVKGEINNLKMDMRKNGNRALDEYGEQD